jgi:hypothetical protein
MNSESGDCGRITESLECHQRFLVVSVGHCHDHEWNCRCSPQRNSALITVLYCVRTALDTYRHAVSYCVRTALDTYRHAVSYCVRTALDTDMPSHTALGLSWTHTDMPSHTALGLPWTQICRLILR